MKKVFLLAALAVSLGSQAQKVKGAIVLQKGQKLEVVTESKTNTSQEVMGQSMESSSTSTLTENWEVKEAGKNGAALEHRAKRFVLNAEGGMGQGMSFDSDKPEDLKGEMGKLMDKAIMKNTYTVMIDAAGRVTGAQMAEDNPNAKKSDESGMAALMMQQLGAKVDLPKAGDRSVFAVLPATEVSVGNSWTDSTSKDGVSDKRTYKLTGITADEITVDYIAAGKIDRTIEVMQQSATVTGTVNGMGTIVIDRKTGIVKTVTGTSKSEASVEAQGMTIPVNSSTTVKMTVKTL